MFKNLLLIIFLAFSFIGIGQEDYSYISDRKFKDPTDLTGYDFVPGIMEIKGGPQEELSPGEFSFGITQANLFVKGEGIEGVYSINNINSTDYGYKLLLINARNPTIQGHLKVVLNNRAQVDALIFKRTNKEQEVIFYQAQMPENQRNEEDAFFSGRWEQQLEDKDSIWGTSIRPFFRIHENQRGIQERLRFVDSTSIEFIQTVKIVDKRKKKKKNSEEAKPLPSIAEALMLNEDQLKEIGVKLKERRVIKLRSIVNYDDGTTEDLEVEYEVKKMTEREDETAAPDGEQYQIEFELTKGNPVYLYLTPKRTLSAFEADGIRYLLKGY
jgi:hypothetical protein